MSSIHLSLPETPIATSALHEKQYLEQKFPNFEFRKGQARHVHFRWTSNIVFHPFDHDGKLEEVKLGEARWSKEGVRYSQLYSPNPREWVFEVDDEQFSEEILESEECDSEPQPALIPIPEFKIAVVTESEDLPDEALIEIGSSNGIPHWKLVDNGVMACKGEVEFGKPTVAPPPQTVGGAVGSLRRVVTGSIRRLGRTLTGKREA